MSLAKKYGIPEDSIKAMVKDGVIPFGAIKTNEILSIYDKLIQDGLQKHQAVHEVSDEVNVSISYVYRIISKYK